MESSNDSKFKLIFADDHCLVVNKAAGILTTPAHGEDSLVAVLDRKFFGPHQVFPVHRLDRETSGLLVFARTPGDAKALAKQFSTHSVEREYCALVAGSVDQMAGTLGSYIGGKRAITHYKVLTRLESFSLVAVTLETGRRNQIRIHFAEKGHPVLGDTRIGGDKSRSVLWPYERIALHARVLGFWHPTKKTLLRFDSELPPEMAVV